MGQPQRGPLASRRPNLRRSLDRNAPSESPPKRQSQFREMAGPKRLFVGSLLNLAPGFGMGYLVAVQRRLFRVSLFVWVVAGAVIMVGLAGDARCARQDHDPYDMFAYLVPWGFMIFGGALGVLVVNLSSSIHLFVLGATKLWSRLSRTH